MATCEKCWSDAHGSAEAYEQILRERDESGNPCTPEEQAGPDAGWCVRCQRRTRHQWTAECMACGGRVEADDE